MKRLNFVVAWFLAICPFLGAVDVGTSVAEVSHEGYDEVVGTFSLTLNDNAFAHASPQDPVYIRFKLTEFRGWAKTLVDLRANAPDDVDRPINLALSTNSSTTINPDLPRDAVQLVRLIYGESTAWIRITNSSSDWISAEGTTTSPGPGREISLTMGIVGSASVRPQANTLSGGNEYEGTDILADTLLHANYHDTPNFRRGDEESIDFISFDASTSGIEGTAVSPGNQNGVNFSNDYKIARGIYSFPCFEFHFVQDDYLAPGFEIDISRLNLIELHSYTAEVPAVYFSNTSDFDWDYNSRLFLTHDSFNPDYSVYSDSPDFWYDPLVPVTHLVESDVTAVSSNGSIWQVNKVYWKDSFMGYELVLETGKFTIDSRVKLTGLTLNTNDHYHDEPLELSATAYYLASGVTDGSPAKIFPIQREVAEFGTGTASFFEALPYTAYDREDWGFVAQIVNPHAEPVRFTALFYKANSLLLQVLGSQTLAPFSRRTLRIEDEFGVDEARKLSWIYIVSDQPLSTVGIIEDDGKQQLDIFVGIRELEKVLYAPHITANSNWETKAYLLSTDPDKDATFYMQRPGVEPWRIPRLSYPSSTATLTDSEFTTPNGRAPWFTVTASTQVGSGLLLYSERSTNSQLASVPMETASQTRWTFGHVGNPSRGWWNGIAIFNPGESQNAVSLRGYDDVGGQMVEKTISIDPQTNWVGSLEEELDSSLTVPISRLEIVGSDHLVCFLLMGQTNTRLLTTIPGNLPASQELVLPHVPNLAENWAGVALVNETRMSATVTVTPYLPSGEAGVPQYPIVPAGHKLLMSMDSLIPASSNLYSHLLVSSTEEISGYMLMGSLNNEQLATVRFDAIE